MEYRQQNSEVSGVQFHEDGTDGGGWSAIGFYKQNKAPFFVRLLLKHAPGIANDAKRASKILTYMSISFFVLSVFIYVFFVAEIQIVPPKIDSDQILCRDELSPELKATMTSEDIRNIPSCEN